MRRLLLLITLLSVSLAGLTACGGNGSGSSNSGSEAIKGVTVTGEFGQLPTVSVDGLDQNTTDAATLIKGDGPALKDGGEALVDILIANGKTGEKAASTWDQGQPTQVSLNSDSGVDVFVKNLAGATVGSRILLVAPVTDVWGSAGNPQLGMDPGNAVIFVIDVLTSVLDGPQGAKQKVASDLPVPVVKDGKVTGIDFSKSPKKPGKKLQVVTLIKGDGDPVAKGSSVAFNYYGIVYGGSKPFDESYSRGPTTFQVGVGSLIKAWDEGLVGVPTGSRVLIIAPPDYGYGDQAQNGIPAGSTLVFVVDVLGVA